MDSENGDFYSEFKDGRAKLKENENADSKSDDEYDGGNSDEYELEEGMDAESVYGNEEDTGDKNEDDKCPDDKTLCSVNHLGGTDADNEFEADDEQEEEGYKGNGAIEVDDDFNEPASGEFFQGTEILFFIENRTIPILSVYHI